MDTEAETIDCGWASHTAAGCLPGKVGKVTTGHGVTLSRRHISDDFVAYADSWSSLTGKMVSGRGSGRMCVMNITV